MLTTEPTVRPRKARAPLGQPAERPPTLSAADHLRVALLLALQGSASRRPKRRTRRLLRRLVSRLFASARRRPRAGTRSRRYTSVAGYAVVAVLVAGLVVLTCYTAWTQLAGRQLVLIDRAASSAWPSVGIRDLRADHTADPAVQHPSTLRGTADARATGSAEPVRATGGQPKSIDGTTVALIVNLVVIGLGVLIQRAIMRRLRQRDDPRRDGQREVRILAAEVEDEADDSVEVAPDHDDDHENELDHELSHGPDGDPDERSDDNHLPVVRDNAAPTAQTQRIPPATATGALAGPADRVGNASAPTLAHAGSVATHRETTGAADTIPSTSASTTSNPVDLETMSAPSIVYDRRERLRVSYQGRARLQWAGHDLACETINLDIMGVRCAFPAPPAETVLAPGTSAWITLMLDGVLLQTPARVTSSASEDGQWRVGVRFTSLNDDYRAFLLTFLDGQDRLN